MRVVMTTPAHKRPLKMYLILLVPFYVTISGLNIFNVVSFIFVVEIAGTEFSHR